MNLKAKATVVKTNKEIGLIWKFAASLASFAILISSNILAQNEHLDRGLVVAKGHTEGQYFASWRMLSSDDANTSFTILKDGKPYKENILNSTSVKVYGKPTTKWQIVASRKTDNIYIPCEISKAVLPWNKPYLELKVTPPPVAAANSKCKYTANDCSVGDVDGDGQYELFIKWDPTDSHDNSHYGYTCDVFISCYKLDMENPTNAPKCLWTIDLGKNIRAGAHYTQFMVYDFDGDGKAEMICKTAPGSKDGLGNYVNQASSDKAILSADNSKDWRNKGGRVTGGQEYLTVFSGIDGHAINTIFYQPNRNAEIGGEAKGDFNWNTSDTRKKLIDNAEYGNRGERYLACVAYLDGMDKKPSAIFTRGYYTYAFAWAVNFDGKQLKTKWINISRDSKQYSVIDATGKKTTYTAAPPTSGFGSGTLYGNGNHNLCVADVDGDGCDEMIWGAATLDNDGKMLYATGLGHGDAVHIADLNPNRPGYEVFDIHENKGKYCWDVHDAATGEILLKGGPEGVDNGRGLTARLDTNIPEYLFWSADDPALRSTVTGKEVMRQRASINYRIYWDGDLEDELLDGTNINKVSVNGNKVLGVWGEVNHQGQKRRGRNRKNGFQRPSVSFHGLGNPASNNWTKNNPCLQADLFGDWREEVIYRDADDNTKLYIYMSQIPTTHRTTTLMQDHVYRMSICWQNVGYNQPPYVGKVNR